MHGCLNAQVYRRRRSYAAVLQNDSKRFERGLVRTRHRPVPSTSAQALSTQLDQKPFWYDPHDACLELRVREGAQVNLP